MNGLRAIGTFCLAWSLFPLMAQVDVHNKGVEVVVKSGAQLSVVGNYTDHTTATDSLLSLFGPMYLDGNLSNPNNAGVFANPRTTAGTLTFRGTGADTIFTSSRISFPSLNVNSANGITIDGLGGVFVYNTLTLTSGDINLDGASLTLDDSASFVYPNNHRIYGTGSLVVQNYPVDNVSNSSRVSGNTTVRRSGIGLFFNTGGSYGGLTTFTRTHTADNRVANDKSISLVQQINANQPGSRTVDFEYSDAELNGLTESGLKMYFSNDNGGSWVKVPGSIISGEKRFDASGEVTFVSGNNNLITLADGTCNTLPDNAVTYNIGAGNVVLGANHTEIQDTINICLNQDITVNVTGSDASYFQWTLPGSTPLPPNENISFTGVQVSPHEGTYSLFVRNAKGCETTRKIFIDVRLIPEARFTMNPQNDSGNIICLGQTVTFDASSTTDHGDGIANHQWYYERTVDASSAVITGAVTNTGTNGIPTYTYNNSDAYLPSLTVTSNFGCVSNTVTGQITVVQSPIRSIEVEATDGIPLTDPIVICQTDTLNFENNGTIITPTINMGKKDLLPDASSQWIYSWNFDDGTVSSGAGLKTPSHTFNTFKSPVHQIELTVDVPAGVTGHSCFLSVTRNVEVNATPKVDFVIQDASDGVELNINNTGPGNPFYEVCEEVVLNFESVDGTTLTTVDDPTLTLNDFAWDFGDSQTGIEANMAYEYTATSLLGGNVDNLYTVSSTVTTTEGCSSSASKKVKVHPAPEGTITFDNGSELPVHLCVGGVIGFANGTTINPTETLSWDWDFEVGANSPDFEPAKQFNVPGNFRVELTRTSAFGCTNTSNPLNVFVNEYPAADFTATEVCDGDAVSFNPGIEGADVTYLWDFGDGVMSTLANPTYVFPVTWAGNEDQKEIDVSLTITTNTSTSACSDTVIKPVTIYRNPEFSFGANVSSIGSITLNPKDLTGGYVPVDASVKWFDAAGTELLHADSYTFTETGQYFVEVSTASFGCTTRNSLVVYVFPAVDLGPDRSFCENDELDATFDDVSIEKTYEWFRSVSGMDVSIATPTPESRLPITESGIYKLRLTFDVPGDPAVTEDEVELTLDDNFILSLPAEKPLCSGDSVLLDAGVTALNYNWTGPDNSIVSTARSFYAKEPGGYDLVVTNGTCSGSATIQLNPVVAPTAVIDPIPAEICLGESIQIKAGQTEGSISWDLGDGTTGTLAEFDHTYSTEGNYTITLTTATANCPSTATREVTVRPVPTAGFSFSGNCEDEMVEFVNLSSSANGTFTSFWSFGDGATSTLRSPVHTYTGPGIYDVQLEVTSQGCTHLVNQTITIDQKPVIDLDLPVVSCSGSVTIDPAGTEAFLPVGATYDWYDPSGSSIGTGNTLTTSASGVDSLHVVTLAGCERGFDLPVFVAEPIDLGGDRTTCDQITLTDDAMIPSGVIVAYAWLKDGLALTNTAASLVVNETGIYTLQRTISAGPSSCTTTSAVNIQIDEQPVLDLGPDVSVCDGATHVFDAGQDFDAYYWIQANGDTVGRSRLFETAVLSTYQLSAYSGACEISGTVQLLRKDSPTSVIQADQIAVCLGTPINFSSLSVPPGGQSIDQIQWDFDDGTTSDQSTFSKTYASAGDYSVTLKIASNGCTATSNRLIKVNPMPQTDFNFVAGCADESVHFTNTSSISGSGSLTYQWDFGDLTTSTDLHPNHDYAAAGTYNVTLTATDPATSCSTTASKVVTVKALPVIGFSPSTVTCANSLTFTSPVTASAYRWFDGTTGLTLSNASAYTVVVDRKLGLEVTASNGCVQRDTTEVTLNTPVTIDLGADRTVCGSVTLDAGSFPGGFFDWGGGNIGQELEVTASGTYAVNVIDQNGCTGSASVNITVETPPIVDLGADQSLCGVSSIVLDAGNPGLTYLWSTGETTQTITAHSSGSYRVAVTSASGFCVISDEVNVQLDEAPTAVFTHSEVCFGEEITFNNTSTIGNGATLTYLWDFGDGTISTDQSPPKTYAAAGTYPVVLTVTSSSGSCTDSFSTNVTVHEGVTTGISLTDGCVGQAISFNGNITFGGNSSDLDYFWDFGDGTSSTALSPAHTYAEAGNFMVTFTSTDRVNGCSSTSTESLEIFALPVIGFPAQTTTCGNSLTISSPISGTNYRWYDHTDGTTLSTTNEVTLTSNLQLGLEVTNNNGCVNSDVTEVILNTPVNIDLGSDRAVCGSVTLDAGLFSAGTYDWGGGINTRTLEVTASGTYSVNVTDQNGCMGSARVTISVEEPPLVDLGSDQNLCGAQTVVLDAGNAGSDFLWSTGATTQTISVATTGVYSVQVTSVSGVCTVSDEVSITINEAALVDFDASNVCFGEVINFTNNTSIANGATLSYVWDFGDGTTSTLANPAKTYDASGTYDVTLVTISSTGGCLVSVSKTIAVHPKIEASFSTSEVCDLEAMVFKDQTTFEGSASNLNYSWDFGDGTTSSMISPSHIYSTDGMYQVTLAVSDQTTGCLATYPQDVTVMPLPVIGFSDESTTCGSSIDFTAPSVANYRWFDANTNVTLSNLQSYTANANRLLGLKVVGINGCIQSDTTNVRLNTPVSIDLGADRTICESVTLDAGFFPGGTFDWGDGITTQTREVTTSGSYSVQVVDQNGCMGSAGVNITVEIPPGIDLGPDQSSCGSSTVVLDAATPGASYLWSTSETTSSIEVTSGGTYRVEVTSSSGVCSVSDEVSIAMNTAPVAAFQSTNVCFGDRLTLTNNSTIADDEAILSYLWTFGDGTTSTQKYPSKLYTSAGRYTVNLEVTSSVGSCTHSTSQQVIVYDDFTPSFTFGGLCGTEATTFTNTTSFAGADEDMVYHWDFGDGTSSGDVSPTHVYTSSGTYIVRLKATVGGICVKSTLNTIEIFDLPEVQFGSSVSSCSVEITLDAGIGNTYLWSDGSTERTLTVTSTGDHTVTVTGDGGCTTTATVNASVFAQEALDLGTDRSTCDQEVLDATTADAASYSWSTGVSSSSITVTETGSYGVVVTTVDGCIASDNVFIEVSKSPDFDLGQDVSICVGASAILDVGAVEGDVLWSTGAVSQSITASESGTYSATVTNGSCSTTDQVVVTVNELPSAAFTANSVCIGTFIEFISETPLGNDASYFWDFGDGTQSESNDPTKIYSAAGTFEVSLTVKDLNGCQATSKSEWTTFDAPQANFNSQDVCEGEQADFINLTSFSGEGNLTYAWSFGDATSSTERNPSHSYTEGANYQIRLFTQSEQGCFDSETKEKLVGAKPSFKQSTTVVSCDPSIVLDAGNEGSTYRWNDNSSQQTLTVTTSGLYQVEVTNEQGCRNTLTVDVALKNGEKPNLGNDFEACGEALLDPNIAALSYLWSTGEITSTIMVNATDEYRVEIVTTDFCVNADTVDAVIHPLPEFELGEDLTRCNGEFVEFAPNVAGAFNWSTGATTNNIRVTETTEVGLEVTSDKGCTFRDTVNVLFNPLPVIAFEDRREACDQTVLDGGPDGAEYLWSNGATTRTIDVLEDGLFWISVTSPEGCVSQDTTSIVVYQSPVSELASLEEICDGSSLVLDPGASNAQYEILWNNGSTNRQLEVGASGIYWVDITSLDGCKIRDSVELVVRPPIALELGEDVFFCNNSSNAIDAGIDVPTYSWSSNIGQTGTTRAIEPESYGVFYLDVVDDFGCEASDEIELLETSNQIEASFLVPSEIIQGDIIQFIALTDPPAASYYWDFGISGAESTRENPLFQYFSAGEYTVTLTVSNGICSSSLSKQIVVRELGGRTNGAESEIFQFIEIMSSNLYPNPVEDKFHLQLSLSKEAKTLIRVFNIEGNQLLSHETMIEEGELVYDIQSLAEGMYTVTIEVASQMEILRFVKTR